MTLDPSEAYQRGYSEGQEAGREEARSVLGPDLKEALARIETLELQVQKLEKRLANLGKAVNGVASRTVRFK